MKIQNYVLNVSNNVLSFLKNDSALSKATVIALGVITIIASAHIRIPFWPVPMTAQTAAVLLLGMLLGPVRGSISTVAYASLTALHVPMVATAHGIVSPTFGYIFGYIFTAIIMGYLFKRINSKNIVAFFAVSVLALVPTFGFGLAWLGYFMGYNKALLAAGLLPFIFGEAAKIVVLFSMAQFLNHAGKNTI